MKQENYHASINVTATPREALEKISRVPEWWGSDLEGSAGKLNDEFTIHFGETWVKFKISERVPDKKVVWKVVDSYIDFLKDKKEWNNTSVVYEISEQDKKARIDMTHVGLVPEIECYKECNEGWNFFIKKSLFKFINTGVGLPDVMPSER